MITLDDKDLKRYENDLKIYKRRAFPFATKQTINSLAFKAQAISKQTIKKKMILKNRFSLQSIRVNQSKTLNVRRQESSIGSTLDYMEDQEFGVTKTKDGKKGVALATGYAAGQQGTTKRTRLPRRPNQIQNIKLSRKANKAKSRKQRNLILIKDASQSSRKFVYLNLGKTKGIFKVVGGKKKAKIKMVYNLSKQSVRIPKNPWLNPSIQETIPHGAGIYKKAIIFQLKRFNLFHD